MSQSGILNRAVFPPFTVTETLTGNTGGPVGPDGANNINVVGDGTTITVAGNPGTNTLTISTVGGVGVESLTTDDGHVVTPTAGTIILHGTHGLNTTGTVGPNTATVAINNTITLGDLTPLGANVAAVTLTTGDLKVTAGNIQMPFTNTGGSQGVIEMGGVGLPFLHGAGPVNGAVGPNNVFLGGSAGNVFGTTGSFNVGIGRQAMENITSGQNNIGIGILALGDQSTGSDSISFGSDSLTNAEPATQCIAIGSDSQRNVLTPTNNISIGYFSASAFTTSESNNITIGSVGVVGDNGVTRIGTNGTNTTCFITGIDGVDVGSVATVVTEASDQLGTAVLTAGSGITITPSANVITIASTGGGSLTWSVITADQTAVVSNGYFCNKAGTLALALPATSAVGDIIEVTNENTALGVQFTQGGGQQILIGNTNTTLGGGGTLTSSAVGDTLKIVCMVADTVWRTTSMIGNWTPV